MSDYILTVDQVTKKIRDKTIIKGISLNIREGEVLGFLGPNGAGKSTTLRMIVGLSKPTTGQITVCGYSITGAYVKAMSNVGCMIEGPDLYNYTTGYNNLEMLGVMSEGVGKSDIDHAVELVGMGNRINDKVATYSMGMKQRLGLAQALIHNPRLLILDEPTNGLDPQGIYEFREIIKNLAREKQLSVLISSHLISEVQLMCDRVSIINNGLIIRNANVSQLLSSGEVFWVLDDPLKAQQLMKGKFNIITELVEDRLEGLVSVDRLSEINTMLIQEGLGLRYVSAKNRTLEEMFLNLTENQKIL